MSTMTSYRISREFMKKEQKCNISTKQVQTGQVLKEMAYTVPLTYLRFGIKKNPGRIPFLRLRGYGDMHEITLCVLLAYFLLLPKKSVNLRLSTQNWLKNRWNPNKVRKIAKLYPTKIISSTTINRHGPRACAFITFSFIQLRRFLVKFVAFPCLDGKWGLFCRT